MKITNGFKIASRFCLMVAIGLCVWMAWQTLKNGEIPGCAAGKIGCSEVLTSRFSKISGVPVSVAGAFLYLSVFCFSLRLGLPSVSRSGVYPLLTGCWVVLLAACWFVGLQFFVFHQFCLFCCLIHLFACFGALGLLREIPRHGKPPPRIKGRTAPGLAAVSTARFLCFVTAILVVFSLGLYQFSSGPSGKPASSVRSDPPAVIPDQSVIGSDKSPASPGGEPIAFSEPESSFGIITEGKPSQPREVTASILDPALSLDLEVLRETAFTFETSNPAIRAVLNSRPDESSRITFSIGLSLVENPVPGPLDAEIRIPLKKIDLPLAASSLKSVAGSLTSFQAPLSSSRILAYRVYGQFVKAPPPDPDLH